MIAGEFGIPLGLEDLYMVKASNVVRIWLLICYSFACFIALGTLILLFIYCVVNNNSDSCLAVAQEDLA